MDKTKLEELMEELEFSESFGDPGLLDRSEADAAEMNGLYDARRDELMELARIIGGAAELNGRAGGGGFVNPALTLSTRVRAGDLDEMPMDAYNSLVRAVEDMAILWEGRSGAQGMPLACNAIMRAVLEDAELFDRAHRHALGIVEAHAQAIERHYDSSNWTEPGF